MMITSNFLPFSVEGLEKEKSYNVPDPGGTQGAGQR